MSQPHLACSSSPLAESLDQADSICSEHGGKLTPLRRKVLSLLIEAPAPTKAYDLLDKLGGASSAKPPTVYRSLDFLIEMGLVHRIESLNAYVVCGHWRHGHAAAFLICENCGGAGELHADASMETLAREASAVQFRMRSASIEVRGLCGRCAD